ncbi:MAG: hypothetical protein ACK5T0_05850 [Vampirovibrionales bacterium]
MNFNLANLAMLSYTPQGKSSLQASHHGGESFMNLIMLQNLSAFIEDYDTWQIATDAQGEALNKTTQNAEIKQNQPSKTKSKSKTSKTKAVIAKATAENLEASVTAKNKITFENTVKAVKSLQEIQETKEVAGTEAPRLTPPADLDFLTPQQQIWVQQWVQQFPQQVAHGAKKPAGLDDGRSLSGTLQKPFAEEALSETGKGKAPTATERMDFLKFLQAQMEEAHKKGKPFRVDVDGETSVVLSLKKDGVTATFLVKEVNPDKIKQVHQQLKALQESLQARKLPVKDITVETETPQVKPHKVLETIQHYQELAEQRKSKSKSKKQKPSK